MWSELEYPEPNGLSCYYRKRASLISNRVKNCFTKEKGVGWNGLFPSFSLFFLVTVEPRLLIRFLREELKHWSYGDFAWSSFPSKWDRPERSFVQQLILRRVRDWILRRRTLGDSNHHNLSYSKVISIIFSFFIFLVRSEVQGISSFFRYSMED